MVRLDTSKSDGRNAGVTHAAGLRENSVRDVSSLSTVRCWEIAKPVTHAGGILRNFCAFGRGGEFFGVTWDGA